MASSAVNVREVVSFGPRRKSILVSDEPLLDPFVKVAVVTLVLSDCPKLVRVSSCTMIARCAHHWHMHNASEERGGKRGGGEESPVAWTFARGEECDGDVFHRR